MSREIIYVPGQGLINEMFGKTYTDFILRASGFDPLQNMFCERRVLIPSNASKLWGPWMWRQRTKCVRVYLARSILLFKFRIRISWKLDSAIQHCACNQRIVQTLHSTRRYSSPYFRHCPRSQMSYAAPNSDPDSASTFEITNSLS